jgi:hypothetical protein
MEGTYFLSDEHMRHYIVNNSKGSFEKEDLTGEAKEEEQKNPADTVQQPEPILRPKAEKTRRSVPQF